MQKSMRMSGLQSRMDLAPGLRHPNEEKVIIRMPDVMDELSKSPRPLAAEPPDEEPRRSPVDRKSVV